MNIHEGFVSLFAFYQKFQQQFVTLTRGSPLGAGIWNFIKNTTDFSIPNTFVSYQRRVYSKRMEVGLI